MTSVSTPSAPVQPQPNAGPWRPAKSPPLNGVSDLYEIHWSDAGECVAEIVHGEANARLIAAACTSYDKHCGPRAVECAESDLLGEAVKALDRIAECECPTFAKSAEDVVSHLVDIARDVLAKLNKEGR